MSIWAFRTIPNVFFCSSASDPCSCSGGGFEIYEKFCNVSKQEITQANGTDTSNITFPDLKAQARAEYVSIVEALDDSGTVILVTTVVGIVIGLIFALVGAELDRRKAEREVVQKRCVSKGRQQKRERERERKRKWLTHIFSRQLSTAQGRGARG